MVFQPVGPESSDVYWRRRAVMLGVLGVALVLVLAMCARGGGGSDTRAAAATSSASAGASEAALGGGLDDPLSSTDPSAGAPGPGASNQTGSAASVDASASGGAQPAALAATRAPAASGAAVPASSASGDPASTDAASAEAMDPAAAELAGSPSPSGAASGSASASAAPAGTCADGALRVAVRTDARTYAAGAEPRITLTVTNAGTAACTRDLGSAALSVVVTSGADRIWSSDDCGGTGAAKPTRLAAGASWSTSVTWSATRTSPGHCTARVAAKPGFYQVAASAGAVSSALYRFQLG